MTFLLSIREIVGETTDRQNIRFDLDTSWYESFAKNAQLIEFLQNAPVGPSHMSSHNVNIWAPLGNVS